MEEERTRLRESKYLSRRRRKRRCSATTMGLGKRGRGLTNPRVLENPILSSVVGSLVDVSFVLLPVEETHG